MLQSKKTKNRIAAIDIGTNSFHLVIVELNKDGSFTFLDREREVMRLGSQQGKDLSIISDDEIERATKILSGFANLAKHYNAGIRAISTSAVREANNQKEFIEIIYKKTGINVEVAKGSDEARLIFLGIQKALKINDKKVLCLDIGGGSTEFIYAENSKIHFAESVKIGAVRLSKLFFHDYIITESAVKECANHVQKLILENKNIDFNINIDFAVGVSGTIDTIYHLSQAKKYKRLKNKLNGYKFLKEEFEEFYNQIMNLKTSAERKLVPGMEAKRADIIPAGLIILKEIINLFNIKKFVISEYALREGIVIDTANRYL